MKSLYLRIYATVVVVLLLFALVSGWVLQRHLEQERTRNESILSDRLGAWAELIQRSLPGTDAPREDQAAALREWSMRLRLPLALDDASGQRVGASDSFVRRSGEGVPTSRSSSTTAARSGRCARRPAPASRATANGACAGPTTGARASRRRGRSCRPGCRAARGWR